ncbi:hypothetical protein [Plantactinospora sp. WMMB782]|uniref:hypothetical protein n=1 Tax=Plantactinospora sp. WMMB782 TaxID=3404121 RepID=UPI003B94DF44
MSIPNTHPTPEVTAIVTALAAGAGATTVHYETTGRVLDALDLPSRDARVRAEVAEEIARAIEVERPSAGSFWDTADAARVYALNDAAKVARKYAAAPAESVAAGSAVPVEGSGLPQPAPQSVGRLPWPYGPDPVTDTWLREQGADPVVVRDQARQQIDALVRPRPILSLDTGAACGRWCERPTGHSGPCDPVADISGRTEEGSDV